MCLTTQFHALFYFHEHKETDLIKLYIVTLKVMAKQTWLKTPFVSRGLCVISHIILITLKDSDIDRIVHMYLIMLNF